MKRLTALLILCMLLGLDAYAGPPTIINSGTAGILTDSNCDQAKYYSLGTLCQDTDDKKLYKGIGSGVEEIAAGSSGDMTATTYVTDGKIKTATGGTGLDTSGSTGYPSLSSGTWSILSASDLKTALGLVIGTNVQAYDADLTTYAGITPSANVQTLLGSADYAAFRSSLGVFAANGITTNSSGNINLPSGAALQIDGTTVLGAGDDGERGVWLTENTVDPAAYCAANPFGITAYDDKVYYCGNGTLVELGAGTGSGLPEGGTAGQIVIKGAEADAWGNADGAAVGYSAENYTPAAATIGGHLAGLDAMMQTLLTAFNAAGLNTFSFSSWTPASTPFYSNSADVAISVDVTDTSSTYAVAGVKYQIDSGGYGTNSLTNTSGITWGVTIEDLTETSHTLQIQATDDKSGTPNTGESSERTIVVDLTDPVVNAGSDQTHDGTGQQITISGISITETNEDKRERQIYNTTDSSVVSAYTTFTGTSFSYTLPADTDNYRFDVRVTDLAGRTATDSVAVTYQGAQEPEDGTTLFGSNSTSDASYLSTSNNFAWFWNNSFTATWAESAATTTASKIYLRFQAWDATACKAYITDSSGTPITNGISSVLSGLEIEGSASWYQFTLGTPATIEKGQAYKIAGVCNGTVNVYYADTGSDMMCGDANSYTTPGALSCESEYDATATRGGAYVVK